MGKRLARAMLVLAAGVMPTALSLSCDVPGGVLVIDRFDNRHNHGILDSLFNVFDDDRGDSFQFDLSF